MDLPDPTRISPELARLLGYNSTELESLELPTTTTIKPDLAGSRETAFLGIVQPHTERSPSTALNENQRRQLARLQIAPGDTHYYKGLIHTRLRDERGPHSPDIVLLHDFVVRRVQRRYETVRGKQMDDLVAVLSALHLRIRRTDNLQLPIQLVLGERDLLLAQIGSLFLPPWFYQSLASPISFLEHTAPAVGLFTMAVATDATPS